MGELWQFFDYQIPNICIYFVRAKVYHCGVMYKFKNLMVVITGNGALYYYAENVGFCILLNTIITCT